MEILKVENLSVDFLGKKENIKALRNINFSLKKGETLGLVGESGCGKSLTSLAIMGLLPEMARVRSGRIIFQEKNLLELKEKEWNQIRGRKISMIFQDPMNSLDPCYHVGDQICEMILAHEKVSKLEAHKRARALLEKVGIADSARRLKCYPHEFSGGMCQRVMIAMSLAASPEILIADEPTTALDVTIQAQILDLLKDIQKEFKMAMIFISHDLSVVKKMCDHLAVMYLGEIVEEAEAQDIFSHPRHPYTQGLIKSLPAFQQHVRPKEMLYTIAGCVPTLSERPPGCQFSPRCHKRRDHCEQEIPLERGVRCLYPEGEAHA